MLNMMKDMYGINELGKDFALSGLHLSSTIIHWALPNAVDCATTWL